MRTVFFLLSICMLAPLISTVSAAEIQSNYRGEISAVRNGTIDIKTKGEVEFRMTSDNNWSMTIDVKGSGLKSEETSTGEIHNNVIRPVRYEKKSKFFFVKENIDWSFNWSEQELTGNVKRDEHEYDLNSIIHDPLSYQVAMRQSLMAQNTTFNYSYLRYNRPQDLSIEVIGQERLKIGSGFVNTLILQQLKPIREGQRKLIWVAPELDYTPLRFTTYEDDKIKDNIVVTKLWINDERVIFGE